MAPSHRRRQSHQRHQVKPSHDHGQRLHRPLQQEHPRSAVAGEYGEAVAGVSPEPGIARKHVERPEEPLDLVSGMRRREARLLEGTIWRDATSTVLGRLDPVALVSLPGHEPAESLARGDVVDEETFQPHRVERGLGPSGMAGPTIVHGGADSKQDDINADTEIFLRHVDAVVIDQASRPTGLPLVLVAGPKLAATFRGLSKNDLLLDDHIAKDPHLMDLDELAAAVANVFAAAAAARLAREIHLYEQGRAHDFAAGDLSDVGRAAVAGRVATLLIEADRFEPGRFDRTTGAIEFDGAGRAGEQAFGHDFEREDVFGAVAETVLAHGGTIVSVPRIDMPTESGVAAIYRY